MASLSTMSEEKNSLSAQIRNEIFKDFEIIKDEFEEQLYKKHEKIIVKYIKHHELKRFANAEKELGHEISQIYQQSIMYYDRLHDLFEKSGVIETMEEFRSISKSFEEYVLKTIKSAHEKMARMATAVKLRNNKFEEYDKKIKELEKDIKVINRRIKK